MDLTINIENTCLNIRVAVIMESATGLILQHHEESFYFLIGGRVKLNETSLQAAIREVEEETGFAIGEEKFTFLTILENFFEGKKGKTHELCFVYRVSEKFKSVPEIYELEEVSGDKIRDIDLRPVIMKEILLKLEKGEQIEKRFAVK